MPELKRLRQRGQSSLEFVIAYAGVLIPLTFAIIFTAQILWIWHSVNDFTRRGADYAATHCWTSGGGNVVNFMRTNAGSDATSWSASISFACNNIFRSSD